MMRGTGGAGSPNPPRSLDRLSFCDFEARSFAAAGHITIMICCIQEGPRMPKIRPISDLRNKSQEISRICHETGEPVFITKNGEGDLVVLSLAAYERDQARLELYRLLDEAEADVRSGDRGVSPSKMRKLLQR
jgi:prevent-host-death family protein